MRRNNFKLALLISLVFFGFTAIILNNNINLLKDNVVENLENFSEDLKISAWNWTITEVVSTESIRDSLDPTIAVDDSGNLHIAWYDLGRYEGSGTDWDIFYKRWNATTATWTTTEVVSTESTDNSVAPTITVDGFGNVHIAWYGSMNYSGSGTDADIFYKRWDATTTAWTTTEVVSTESTSGSAHPTIASDGSGNVHIAWWDATDYGGATTGWDIFYKRWNATTATWTTTELVTTEITENSGKPTIAADASGNMHITWHDYTSYGSSGTDSDIFYKRWNATTAAWTTTEVVTTGNTGNSYEPTITADDSGNAHIAWEDNMDYGDSGTDKDIFYKRWNATTATWTTTEVVSTESTEHSRVPTIAVDGSGNAHISWHDSTNYSGSGTDWDIFYKRWNATTATWTTTEVISMVSTDSSYPTTIAVDSSGNAHIAWEDETNYGGSGTDDDIFYKKFISSPLSPSIIINNGDASTNSTLVNLALSADGATEMCFRNGTSGAWTDWGPYATAKQLYLEGSINNTEYSIYVKFRNAIGETTPVGDSIIYLTIPLNPSIIINNGDASTDSTLVNLALSADGATEMCFRNGTSGAWTDWGPYATAKQLYLEGSINNTEYSIYVKFRNAIGETSPVSDSILYLIIEEMEEEEIPPIIPGYPQGWIIISLLAGIGKIVLLNKSKRIKLRS